MRRRTFLKGLPVTLVGSRLLGTRGRVVRGADSAVTYNTSGMNVLLITIEDLAAHALGCYGNSAVKTPHLDRFAATATRFARCYCQAPTCNPSRSSFLTGLRPDTTGVYGNTDPMDQLLPEGTRSLPEILHQYGIHTVNIGKLFHRTCTASKQLGAFDRLEHCALPAGYRGESRGLAREDQEAKGRPAPLEAERGEGEQCTGPGPKQYDVEQATGKEPQADMFGDSGLLEPRERDGRKARLAAHILGQLAQEKKPFFLSLGFSTPHSPPPCPGSYRDLYDLCDIASPPAPPEADANIPAVAKGFGRNGDIFNSAPERPVTDEVARKAILAYYGWVSFVDAQIGIVLDALDRVGLGNDTIVIIFGDHGCQLGEHGLWRKHTLFEQSTRVPLLVRVPGLAPKGALCDEIVELVDLLPTLCDLLVIPPPEDLEGTSFVPLLSDPRQPWKLAAFSICAAAGHIGRSVRTKRWRFSDWQSRKTSRRQFELYDLDTDPWEQNNLALNPDYRNQRTILANLLQRGWRVAHQRPATEPISQVDLPSPRARHILW